MHFSVLIKEHTDLLDSTSSVRSHQIIYNLQLGTRYLPRLNEEPPDEEQVCDLNSQVHKVEFPLHE